MTTNTHTRARVRTLHGDSGGTIFRVFRTFHFEVLREMVDERLENRSFPSAPSAGSNPTRARFNIENPVCVAILGYLLKKVIFGVCIKPALFQCGENAPVNIRSFQTTVRALVGGAWDSPQISSGTGCWRGCISPPSPQPPCSCPRRPCRRPADWPVNG